MTERFAVFPQFENPALAGMVRSRHRLGTIATEVFTGTRIQDRFVQELAREGVLNTKEVLESFEFHRRVRRRIRSPEMADLCCGHGLTGVLFALLETTVEHVTLVDHRRPESVGRVIDAAIRLAPWIQDKLTYLETPLEEVSLGPNTGVVGVHACGKQTDRVLDIALASGGPVAVMPCCYRTAPKRGPKGVRDHLGTELAADIDRSYRLRDAGLQVDWDAIPQAVTPMNRILIGWRPHAH